jgi:OFA family oxalate/formate antiporter-like MFS transporter
MIDYKENQSIPDKPRIFYGYIVVVIAMAVMLLAMGTRTSFGIFFKPMIKEFGWSRGGMSAAVTLSMLVQGVWGIFMGKFNDKFGPRPVITLCCFLTGLGFILVSTVSSFWHIYLYYGLIVGLGMGGVFVVLISTVSRWFFKKRGTMTGIVLSGMGISTLVMAPVANWLIVTFGWQLAFVILGSSVLVIGIGLSQFLKRDPSKMGIQPFGKTEKEESTITLNTEGLFLKEAIRTWQFWIVTPIFLCLGYCMFSIIVHFVPYVTDTGTSATLAANILALSGGVQVFGGIIWGGIIDKIGNKRVLILCFVSIAASIYLLIPYNYRWVFFVVSLLFGVGIGGGVVTESGLIADLFGMKSHGLILGIVSFSFTIGSAIGPLITGYVFDMDSSYQTAFLICTILSIAGLILTAMLKPTRRSVPFG